MTNDARDLEIDTGKARTDMVRIDWVRVEDHQVL